MSIISSMVAPNLLKDKGKLKSSFGDSGDLHPKFTPFFSRRNKEAVRWGVR
ncbi:hypothetical protein [Caballeronia novacaledonica]|uniref:hypothetical protein n=1 Tax=Caballeronia novacaledonica TaxID=1544861 RepID=UPI0015E63518|nr:hypothetical protein [Caballeronia novacaledonica]